MAGPAGTHLQPDGPARVLRVHDRGNPGAQRDAFRAAWKAHGAGLVSTFDALIGDGKLDGVVVCAGKNGDDVRIIAELARLLQARCSTRPFIMHMSTVSAGFTIAAHAFCTQLGVGYVNYPLTGGPLGAQLGGGHPNGMLILASGDLSLKAAEGKRREKQRRRGTIPGGQEPDVRVPGRPGDSGEPRVEQCRLEAIE